MNELVNSLGRKTTKKSSLDLGTRKRIPTDVLINKYPDGITLTGCALFHNKDTDTYYGVITFKENDNEFYSGGVQLTNMISKWFADYGEEKTQKLLRDEENPVKIKVSKITYKGKVVNKIDFVC